MRAYTYAEYWFLRRFFRPRTGSEPSYQNQNKLRTLLGEEFLQSLHGKTVIDFGCGHGNEAIEMIRHGAAFVIGVDTWEEALAAAKRNALAAGVADRCEFVPSTDRHADVIVSLDAFEHFSDPAAILNNMAGLLPHGGEVIISFGPTWLHPKGGHLFSVFPWAHLLFSERALLRWRSDYRDDGAKSFGEVAGGLNRMTLRRFEKIVDESAFRIRRLEKVPIRSARVLHNRLTEEFLTSIVRCSLVKTG